MLTLPSTAFAKFARGAERLDQMACSARHARQPCLRPTATGRWRPRRPVCSCSTIGTQAYRQGEIGEIGGVATYMSQNVPTYHRHGGQRRRAHRHRRSSSARPTLRSTETEATPGTMVVNLTGGWGATDLIKAGTVFTIGTGVTAVHAVNPVTKAVLPFQQHVHRRWPT